MTPAAPRALAHAAVSPAVWGKHPEYSAVIMTVTGLRGGPSDARSEAMLAAAEAYASSRLASTKLDEMPELQAWRGAFATFGVKPRVARSSVEALVRRSANGLPRVDRLTDLYNAVSILHLGPIGGEDLSAYVGAPRLVVADGTETFDTIADGVPTNLPPEPGELVWRDDIGVTCRRWNWRQCTRTRLMHDTRNVLFILDGLGESGASRAADAADDLTAHLTAWWPDIEIHSRTLAP